MAFSFSTFAAAFDLQRAFQRAAPAGGTNATATPAGVSMTSAVGTASETGTAVATPTGVAAVASVGSAVLSGAAQVLVSGVQMTSAVGTAVAGGAAVGEPLGVSAVASVGTPVATGGALVLPAGVEMVSAVGEAIASGESSSDGTAFTEGVEAVTAVGTALAFGDALVAPLGVSMVASVGQAVQESGSEPIVNGGGVVGGVQGPQPQVLSVDATAYPKGVQMRARVGSVTASGEAVVQPAGVELVSAVGAAVPSGEASIFTAGVETHAIVGKGAAFSVQAGRLVTKVEHFARPRIARPIVQASVEIVHAQPDVVDRAWTDLQLAHEAEADHEELLLLGVFDA